MLREFEFFHGVVLAKVLHATDRAVSFDRFSDDFNAGYVLNGSTGIYVKHCNRRLTPWRFSFQPEHLQQMQGMKGALGTLFVVLVCDDDGIVCLSHDEVAQILNPQHDATKSVRVHRRRRHMYSVTGSDGELEFKVGAADFSAKLFGTSSPASREAVGKS